MITLILLDTIILVFLVDVPIPLAEEAIVTEVGKAAVPEDAEDADPNLVADNDNELFCLFCYQTNGRP